MGREIRPLVSFFAAWSMREKFSRLNQIATILNLEAVSEINDFHENWKLTPTEMKQTLSLRVDFSPEEVKKLSRTNMSKQGSKEKEQYDSNASVFTCQHSNFANSK